ncbi:MAG TPA: hypothetical protein VNB90_06045 [Cytophagaceae bacterium]|jgi:hypothetical protein|nr:hypothetical protein [Cytophagaceae bacterium]
MTLILNWLNKEDPKNLWIWTVADTKISNEGNTLTLEGSKILELPVRCKNLSVTQQIYYEAKLTYAFAGSSLTGLNIYCTLYSILTNLGGMNNSCFPDYQSILLKAQTIFNKYYEVIQSPTEILISGFCPKTREAFQGRIFVEKDQGSYKSKVEVKKFDSDKLTFEILGDKKEEITSELISRLEKIEEKNINYWRMPQTLIKDIIRDQRYESIGGNIQLSINNINAFHLMAIVEPKIEGQPAATMKFRNLDLYEDIGTFVGDCSVSINGMV